MGKRKGRTTTTVRACFQRYENDHGRHIVDQGRLRWAWNHLKSIGAQLVGTNLYAVTARYTLRRKAEGAAEATVRREIGILNAALRHCVKTGIIPYVPPVFMPKRGQSRKLVITQQDITRLLATARDGTRPEWLFRFLALLVYTGQRRDAILHLEWDQVDWKNRLIDFNKAIPLAERRKGRGIVPIHPTLHQYLEEWLQTKRCPYVVQNDYGYRISHVTRPYREWWRLMKDAGLSRDVTPHTIRHTLATMMVRSGIDIRHVQQLLGHRSIVTTEREYVKNDPETIRLTVGKFQFGA